MRWTQLVAGLVAIPVVSCLGLAQGTTGRVTGAITESESGQPLTNATIVLSGTTLGGTSAGQGKYTIANVTPGRYRIRVTLLGYAAREDSVTVTANDIAVVNFAMHRVAVTLQTVVSVGYGTQKRSDLTGAVSSVTPQVERTPITSLEQTLQGTAPGVQVTQASSAPGGGMSIRIRGGSSVNGSNEPLYVIDGFPVDNDPVNGSPTDGGRVNTAPANPLAAINPNDIASIEILKDASATAIYGSRGANGVVLITTKRGSAGKPKVTIDLYSGMQNVAKRYDMLNASEYAQFANEWATSQNLAAPYANPASLGVGTDWQKAIFRQAPMQNLQLSVSGGSSAANATNYSLSGGVFQQNGVVDGSDFRRISFRGNIDQVVGSRLKVGTNTLISRVSSSQVPTDGTFNAGAGAVGGAIQYIPVLDIRKADGTYTLLSNDFPTVLSAIGISPSNVPNPVSMAKEVTDILGDTRFLANAFAEFTVLDGLKLRTSLGSDVSNRSRDTYFPRTTLTGMSSNGKAIRGSNQNTSFLNENTLTFNRSFGEIHDINLLAGYTRQMQNAVKQQASNSNFVSDITGYENLGAGSQVGGPTVSSGRTRWTLASYLARANYTLMDRYLFSVTGRRDGSSRFGTDSRWGFFPAAAVGWRLSEEPFMRNLKHIDQIKLRASWGKAGNPSIQPYQSLTRLTAQQYSFNGTLAPGYYPSALGNNALTWETTKQSDFGLDAGFFQSRVEFSLDAYDKRTDNLLLGVDLPSESGYNTALLNAGSIGNKGFEISLTFRPLVDNGRGSLAWSTTFNYARNKNTVLDLGGVQRIFATQSIAPDLTSVGQGTLVQVGQPLGVFYGYKTNGIFRDSAEVAAYTATTHLASGTITPGQVRIVDVDGSGVIDANDRTIIGNPNPKWTGGWQNTISWKGFELSSLFDATQGNQVLNLNLYRNYGASPGTNISRDRFFDRWTPTNHDGKYPRINSTPVAIGADFTDAVLEDGSFVRLRNVSLSRDIPQKWLGRRGIDRARFYVTGQNLVTWTKYSGYNPDVSSLGVGNLNRGIDIGSYPIARTFIFGINLSY